PWPVVVPKNEQDPELGSKLALELGAVLAWLVAGYADWHANGLADPEAVTIATGAYRSESDALGRFLSDQCMSHGQVRSSDLFGAWSKWCTGDGHDPGTQTAF